MTFDEMKLAVCEKLPHVIIYTGNKDSDVYSLCWIGKYEIHWPTEGLQVCHEAECLLTKDNKWDEYVAMLKIVVRRDAGDYCHEIIWITATYEQRLESLCRVWFPEKF